MNVIRTRAGMLGYGMQLAMDVIRMCAVQLACNQCGHGCCGSGMVNAQDVGMDIERTAIENRHNQAVGMHPVGIAVGHGHNRDEASCGDRMQTSMDEIRLWAWMLW